MIKRCLVRSSTGSDNGKEAKEGARDAGREGGREAGKDGVADWKEGAKGTSSVAPADAGNAGGEAQGSGKKRDREREKDDGGARPANPAKCPEAHRAKETKKQVDACSKSAGAAVSRPTEPSAPSSSIKPLAGGPANSGDSRKEGKSEKPDKGSACGGKDSGASRDAGVEGKGVVGAQVASSKAKGMSKDVNGKGVEVGGGTTQPVETTPVVDCKAGKGKVGAKRRSGEGTGGAEGRASNGAVRSKGAGAEEGEKEETESGEDEGSDAWARGKKRKIAAKKVVLGEERTVVIGHGDGDDEHEDAPVVPSAMRGAMDTESTDSNGISAGGSPSSAAGTGGADTAGGASCGAAGKDGGVGTLALASPSCHGFSEGGKVSSSRVSGRHSSWFLVTLAGVGEDGPRGMDRATQVRAGQTVCIAFDLRDRDGRAVTDEAGLREAHQLITFRGLLPDTGAGGLGGRAGAGRQEEGGDAVWTCGLEPQTQLSKLGDLVCGEIRVMCRTGKYQLRACIGPEDAVAEDLANRGIGAVEVVPGSPSLHRSALTLHLVSGKGSTLGSRARNGKHSARAATKPLLMGATSTVGQDVHAELSVETVCDDSGNVLTWTPSVVEELATLLSVTHIHPLVWGEAQNAVAVCKHAEERKSGEGRLSIEADAESVPVAAVPVPSGSTAAATDHRRVRLFTLRPRDSGNHVLLFHNRGLIPGSDGVEGTLLFHIDILISKDSK